MEIPLISIDQANALMAILLKAYGMNTLEVSGARSGSPDVLWNNYAWYVTKRRIYGCVERAVLNQVQQVSIIGVRRSIPCLQCIKWYYFTVTKSCTR